MFSGQNSQPQAVLVGLQLYEEEEWEFEENMKELALLAESAGAEVLASITQRADTPHPATYIGRGKVQELKELVDRRKGELVIFDDELSPAQQRNVEEVCECQVLDRTQLIMDIFARHARSREGKIQVELAQLEYLLPRLRGRGEMLSRLAGGIGTRGPGETKLEIDQRRIRDRINKLQQRLEKIKQQRQVQRSKRKQQGIPQLSLVGYTNAGKSTLLNRLTGAGVSARNSLFVTLDSTTRSLELPSGQKVLISDTVGFIEKLPHHLIAAFKATLEEVLHSDIILHVINAAHARRDRQRQAVMRVLSELNALERPIIQVYNKIDLCQDSDLVENEAAGDEHGVAISALRGEGIEELLYTIEDTIEKKWRQMKLLLPYKRGELLDRLYSLGQVNSVDYLPEGIQVSVSLEEEKAEKFKEYNC